MDLKVNYTVVGFFVVLLTAALLVIFFWLSTFRHAKQYDTYLIYFHEDVTGLSVRSPVRFSGVPVGFVKDIDLDPENPQLVKLMVDIEDDVRITTSIVASLNVQGVTGVLYVSLKAKRIDDGLLKAKKGEKYPAIPSEPSLLMELSTVLPEMTKNMQSIGESVRKLLDEQNLLAVRHSLENVSEFTKSLAESSQDLKGSIKFLRKTLENSSAASDQLPKVMKQLNTTLASLKNMTKQITQTSHSIDLTMGQSQIVLSNFSDQVMPNTYQVMTRLNMVADNFQRITEQLERNPSMLVRGKQASPLGPGEK